MISLANDAEFTISWLQHSQPTSNPGMQKFLSVYIGSYTRPDIFPQTQGEGIYHYRMNAASGELTFDSLCSEAINPSFMMLSEDQRRLYAVAETTQFDGRDGGGAYAFSVGAETGRLKLINQQPTLGGASCYLDSDKSEQHLLVANYFGNSLTVFPIGEDGSLVEHSQLLRFDGSSINTVRQEAPHPHAIRFDPAGKFALMADLGTDKIQTFRFDNGELLPIHSISVHPGAGPRHLTFSADGRHVYLINEMDATVCVFAYKADSGELVLLQTLSTLPADYSGEISGADIRIAPSGKFVYVSLRFCDCLAVLKVNPEGLLSLLGHRNSGGEMPRNFSITPDGRFLVVANQLGNNLSVFPVDQDSGLPEERSQVIDIPSPCFVLIGDSNIR